MRFTVFQSIRDRTVKNINKYFSYSCIYNVYAGKNDLKGLFIFLFTFAGSGKFSRHLYITRLTMWPRLLILSRTRIRKTLPRNF